MREETERLETSNRAMAERFTSIQGDTTRLMREKNDLMDQVADLRERLDVAERQAMAARSSRQGESSGRMRDLEVLTLVFVFLD